ncbi:hypothetical protein [Amycolatopsis speibonae]|uniref:Spore-associated protein A n=1 Tax=Amycolatopsis speibonae TaxID=1450224 RepID=A0ABV7NY21_9PSEU
MSSVLRRVVVAASGLVMFLGLAQAPAQASTQAVSCSGTNIFSKTVDGLGELVIYYNSGNGGTNSACFYHRGAAYGKSSYTYVVISRCKETGSEGQPCTPTVTSSPDDGDFAYKAGPVGVTGTGNYCVSARGYLNWGGKYHAVESGRQGC